MTIKPTSKRHVTTLLFLLRYYADQQRKLHGSLIEQAGGSFELTPNEMEAWADEIEAEALPGNSTEGWLDT